MSRHDLEKIVSYFENNHVVLSTHNHRGDETLVVEKGSLLRLMRYLKHELGYDFLVDVTAVDYLGRDVRFEVVYHLRAMNTGARLRVKVGVALLENGEIPQIDSIVSIWPAANWLEREVWDLYGISFAGHPDLRRILLYEEFVGHPLRKDYPKEKRQPLVRRENLLPSERKGFQAEVD